MCGCCKCCKADYRQSAFSRHHPKYKNLLTSAVISRETSEYPHALTKVRHDNVSCIVKPPFRHDITALNTDKYSENMIVDVETFFTFLFYGQAFLDDTSDVDDYTVTKSSSTSIISRRGSSIFSSGTGTGEKRADNCYGKAAIYLTECPGKGWVCQQ